MTEKPSRAPPGRELGRLARRLELDWERALQSHQTQVRRQFRDLKAALRLHPRIPPTQVRALLVPKMKPKRGRAKDLRRVEDAVGKALEVIPRR
ncbi:MAG: hypothetical protein ACYDBQ_01885 [Thermoplasmatota archaeon]